jgi:hypothetical protein
MQYPHVFGALGQALRNLLESLSALHRCAVRRIAVPDSFTTPIESPTIAPEPDPVGTAAATKIQEAPG